MAAKANPSVLSQTWRLVRGFELLVMEATSNDQRAKWKKFGTVAAINDTTKGRVGNKTNVALMLVRTTTQADDDPAYSFQTSLLDYKELNTDLLAKFKKGLATGATLTQISRMSPFFTICQHPTCALCRLQENSRPCTRPG